ncbi:hypothetical protein GAMM_230014 [Gammaproteobacteria bacterium]
MVIKFVVSKSGLTEDFIVKIWEAVNDGAGQEVYTQVLVEKDAGGIPTPGAGHQVIETVIVNGMDKVVHIIRLYGVTSATLLHEYNEEPKEDIVTVFTPIRFKIGDGDPLTPIANSDTYTNSLLVGLTEDEYTIERNGYGKLFPTVHYTIDQSTGSFQLNNPDVFNDQEEFTIEKKPKAVTTVVNDSVVAKWFGATQAVADLFIDIAANTDYIAAHLRKLLRFQGAFTYTFVINPPAGFGFCFNNMSASIAKVKFDNANLKWPGGDIGEIDLPSLTEACFVFDGVKWNVVYFNSSTFIVPGATPAGTIIAAGIQNVGDVPAGDPTYTITHNKAIAGDYGVLFSIKSNVIATYFRDNKLCGCWYHHATDKPNKFVISLQEVSGEVQNITIFWTIIKL